VNVLKLHLSAATVATHVGFFVPAMNPFMKSTGNNEIDVVTVTLTGS
jgi:hypothetical protein